MDESKSLCLDGSEGDWADREGRIPKEMGVGNTQEPRHVLCLSTFTCTPTIGACLPMSAGRIVTALCLAHYRRQDKQ